MSMILALDGASGGGPGAFEVRTRDGRYRVYVAASTSSTPNEAASNDSWAIVSALWSD